ncbi:MAG: phosphate ABC transporter substrate-binding protein [Candidatus Margulisiibacteriota bacterium]
MKAFKQSFPKVPLFLFFFVFACLIFSSCARNKIVQIKGSDTMVNLAQALAEDYMQGKQIPIAVTGGGSGVGIAALINNNADIALSSRDMTKHEIELAVKAGVFPNEIQVGSDGVAVVTSHKNPISKLTVKQLSDVFNGKTTNWKELGGPDKEIVALSRDRNSGTHVFFLEEIVKLGSKKNPNEFAREVLMLPSTQAIVEEVASNPEAVGYIGLGYITDRTKVLSVAKKEGASYVFPDEITCANGQYPIARPLFFYTNRAPAGVIKGFIDYVFTKQGQAIVKDMGFVPLKVKGR